MNRAPKSRPLPRTASMIAEDKVRAELAKAALARWEARLGAKHLAQVRENADRPMPVGC